MSPLVPTKDTHCNPYKCDHQTPYSAHSTSFSNFFLNLRDQPLVHHVPIPQGGSPYYRIPLNPPRPLAPWSLLKTSNSPPSWDSSLLCSPERGYQSFPSIWFCFMSRWDFYSWKQRSFSFGSGKQILLGSNIFKTITFLHCQERLLA